MQSVTTTTLLFTLILIEAQITGGISLSPSFLYSLGFVRKKKVLNETSILPKVALTRETSKNIFLKSLIRNHNLSCEVLLLPQLRHSNLLKNRTSRVQFLKSVTTADVIVLTSPQAASEFLKLWSKRNRKNSIFACIGKKTSDILNSKGICTSFIPSEETASCLSLELPRDLGTSVFYPASAIASRTLECKLKARGFLVNRINTYDTLSTTWNSKMIMKSKEVDIVTLASPSAAKNWVSKAGSNFDAVVIGSTTERMARALGFTSVTHIRRSSNCLESMVEGLRNVIERREECGRNIKYNNVF